MSLLATNQEYLAAHRLSPELVKGVVAVSGVYDVRLSMRTCSGTTSSGGPHLPSAM